MSEPQAPELESNPYPGLRPYEKHEFDSFFGRDRQIDELLIRLRDHRFVAVVGLSGSGKSSLVRAGLIRKLEVGHLTSAGGRWRVAVFRPGADPVQALAASLNAALSEMPDRVERLRQNTQGLMQSTREGREPNENLLLVVDQFEELFRFQRERDLSPREAAHFVDLLLAAEQDLSSEYRVYVVLTMRSDSLGEAAQFDGLPEVLNRCQYLVPRMTPEQMREAIEGPAALTDTEIKPDLLQTLLAEAAEGQDQLPLLQHLLMCLWEGRHRAEGGGWEITANDFTRLGGPAEALNNHADQVLKQLQPEVRKDLAKRIFQQLTEIGEGRDQRRPARLSRLAALTNSSIPEVTAVAEHFVAASFLTSPDRGRVRDWEVDITHECLIRQWVQLSEWAKAEAIDRDEYREFSRRAVRQGNLLTGTDLDLALRWLEKNHSAAWADRYGSDLATTTKFVESSREAREESERHAAALERAAAVQEEERKARVLEKERNEQTRRWATNLAVVSAVIAVLVGALAIFAFAQRREADAQRQEADEQRGVAVQQRLRADLQRQNAEEQTEIAKRQADLARTRQGEADKAANDALIQRRRADELRKLAEQKTIEAQNLRDRAMGLSLLSEQQAEEAIKDKEEAARLGAISKWQLLSYHAKDASQQGADDLAALLAREAFLRYNKTPLPTRREVEEALFRTAMAESFGRTLRGQKGTVHSVAFSGDGARLAAAGADGLRIWDLRQTNLPSVALKTQERGDESLDLTSISFSGDSRFLAAGSGDGQIYVWELPPADALVEPSKLSAPRVFAREGDEFIATAVEAVAFSPDGAFLASGAGDGVLRLWDLKSASLTRSFPEKAPLEVNSIRALAFSPDGKRLASGNGQVIHLWDLRAGAEATATLKGHEDEVTSVAFSPVGALLASTGKDHKALVWNLENPDAVPREVEGGDSASPLCAVTFSPDGNRLAVGSEDNFVRVWDIRRLDALPLPLPIEGQDDVLSLAFSPDGRQLASADGSLVHLWDVPPLGTTPRLLYGHSNWVLSAAFSPDGSRVASGGKDGTIRLWDLRHPGGKLTSLKAAGEIWKVAFSPNGDLLASATQSGTVELWDLTRPEPKSRALDDKGYDVVFSPNGRFLAGADGDGDEPAAHLWDLRNLDSPPVPIDSVNQLVLAVAFSPDGTRLASGELDGTIHVWDFNNLKEKPKILKAPDADGKAIRAIAFSPTQNDKLAAGGGDNLVRVWDLADDSGRPVLLLRGHEDEVNSLAFSPDGKSLASAGWDNTVRLWDLEHDRALPVVIEGRQDMNSVAFVPDGSRLVVASDDQYVHVWDLWTRAADQICTLSRRSLSTDEWKSFISEQEEYRRTCAELPPGRSTHDR